jgi:hypothetical protein
MILLPVIAVTMSWLLLRLHDKRQLERVIAEADAEDSNWRLVDLEAKGRTPVPDAENGALVLLKAAQLLPASPTFPFWPVPDAKGDIRYESDVRQALETSFTDRAPPVQLNDRQAAALRAELKRAAAALEQARKLDHFPRGRYQVAWTPDFIGTRIGHIQSVRDVAGLLCYDAQLRAHDRDVDGALSSCAAALNAARSIGDELMLVSQLVRIVCRTQAIHSIERVLAQGQASDAVLAKLQQAVSEEAEAPLLYYGFRGERAGDDSLLELVQRGTAPVSVSGLVNTKSLSSKSWDEVQTVLMMRFSVKSQRAGVLAYMNEIVTAAKLPPDELRGRLQEIEKTLSRRTGMVRMLAPAVGKVAMALDRSRAEARAAAVALAVERYRVANQKWPESLDQLVPKYLTHVPRDPFAAEVLLLGTFDEGIVVYSVGPDGVDNHGNIGKNPMTPGTDIGFRLWDPTRRRQSSQPLVLPVRPSSIQGE